MADPEDPQVRARITAMPQASLWTDFNNPRYIASLPDRASIADVYPELKPGALVLVMDGDGNSCLATVLWLAERLVYFQPDFDTWIAGPEG